MRDLYESRTFGGGGASLAFTLAEVLITLGIIGIVAALTIPTLVNKYKIKQYEVGFKKAYSLLNEAVKTINANDFIISENVTCGVCTQNYDYVKNCQCFPLILSKSFKGAENLKPRFSNNSITYKSFDGSVYGGLLMDDGFFELPNGMSVFFEIQDSTNNPVIIIDTNGYEKLPNRYGFDTFAFIIGKYDKIHGVGDPNIVYTGPFKTSGGRTVWPVSTYCNADVKNSNNGFSCAYKALNESDYWKKLPH